MISGFPERRRAQRAHVTGSWLAMPATWSIQLLDISLSGLAFTSPHPIEVGRTASVRATLGAHALSSEMRVCWSRPYVTPTGQSRFVTGAAFLGLPQGCRQALETFLKLSPAE
jgi:hypothetical protein